MLAATAELRPDTRASRAADAATDPRQRTRNLILGSVVIVAVAALAWWYFVTYGFSLDGDSAPEGLEGSISVVDDAIAVINIRGGARMANDVTIEPFGTWTPDLAIEDLTAADYDITYETLLEENDLELLIHKNRSGPICKLDAYIDAACNVVRDKPGEERYPANYGGREA